MARQYTKVEQLVEIVRERHNQGETYGEIAASYGLERRQVKSLMERQRRKERKLAAGYTQGTPPQGAGQRRRETAQGVGKAANAGGVAAKFSVRSWKEVKLKYRVIGRFRGKYSIEAMCEVFEVSRSGYYAWRNRQQKEAKDQWLVGLAVACQRQGKQTYGIRRVRRWIQRQTGKLVNVKAILRVMRKLDLLSVVRRRRPYTRYQQAVHKYPNLLDRNFDQAKPNQSWVTDITYIPIPGSMLYMCAVLDLCGKAVLAWKIGADMSSSLVTDTILRCTVHGGNPVMDAPLGKYGGTRAQCAQGFPPSLACTGNSLWMPREHGRDGTMPAHFACPGTSHPSPADSFDGFCGYAAIHRHKGMHLHAWQQDMHAAL